jgi:DNA-binding MarR family transcriptional regulator
MDQLTNSYLRFAKLASVFFRDSHVLLNPNQRALLDAIAMAWQQGHPMSVREAISLKKLGSAATLHKRLSILRSEGYLEEYNTESDKRTKLLGLTPKTLLYFETLGAILALQQSSSFKLPSGT